jgi:drug/metabolite transporter (DMT)-like permease
VVYSLSRGGLEGGSPLGDLLLIGAVITSSWGYVFGASAARQMPGWQVISWIVALSLPITMSVTLIMWFSSRTHFSPDLGQWSALVILGVFSAYLGFFAWYRGLAMAGTALGSQVQQFQALLAIGWSAVLLGERVTLGTVLAACVVILAVAWAQRARISSDALSAPLD